MYQRALLKIPEQQTRALLHRFKVRIEYTAGTDKRRETVDLEFFAGSDKIARVHATTLADFPDARVVSLENTGERFPQ